MVEPTALATQVCRNSDDDVVLATAVAGATVLVTGDQDLLVLLAYQGTATSEHQ